MNYKDFFEIEHPILQATMTHNGDWKLAAAISEAGGLGVIMPNGGYSADWMDEQITRVKKFTSKPFSVAIFQRPRLVEKLYLENLDKIDINSDDHKAVLSNLKYNTELSHRHLDVALDHGVKIIQALACEPQPRLVKLCKQKKVKILTKTHSIKNNIQRAKDLGADALILKGYEAAGYIGKESSIEQIKYVDKNILPIISSGGISTCEDIQEHLNLGALAVQIGTRFVCAKESSAHKKYKEIIINSREEESQVSHNFWKRGYPRPTRSIINQKTNKYMNEYKKIINEIETGKITKEEAERLLLRLPTKENPNNGRSEKLSSSIIDGDIENGPVMIGKGINHITEEESVNEIMNKLTKNLKCMI